MSEQEPFEPVPPIRPGDRVLRRKRRARRRLRLAPNVPEIFRFIKEIVTQTPFLPIVSVLVVLWLLFSAGMYFAERGASESMIHSYGSALYWGVTAFSTTGMADIPVTGAGHIIGSIWMVVGTIIFFGAIIASVTSYFMRPRQHPTRQIITTVQYNLGILEELSADELETLRETAVGLIETRLDQLKREPS